MLEVLREQLGECERTLRQVRKGNWKTQAQLIELSKRANGGRAQVIEAQMRNADLRTRLNFYLLDRECVN